MNYQKIKFYEGGTATASGYCVRSIESEEELLQAYRLRHLIFSELQGWVPCSETGMEIDLHDRWAVSLGFFAVPEESSDSEMLIGYMRFLPPDRPFMLEKEFAGLLLSDYPVRKAIDTSEVTRFAMLPHLRNKPLSSWRLSTLLYKGLYQWSLANEIRYLYMVIETRFLRTLSVLGIPCQAIGPAISFPPAGVESVAAILDWEQFRRENETTRPEFLEWMTTIESVHAPWQLQPHALVLTP
ncbi:MAG: hypothetical protein HY037_07530 [Nitrospirae bacterium]|nr:hypothetical protein [Candidatus Troglogloeales bacterium]